MLTDARWGSHYCLFYQSQDDLVKVLAEYFRPGIENGDFCIWVTVDGGVEKKARDTLNKNLAGPDRQQMGTQIEFIPYSEWYLRDGSFRPEQVLKNWTEKLELALNHGYQGLRVTGDLGWLDATNWQTLMGYESAINSVITGLNFMAVCSYPLSKLQGPQIADVIDRHQVALGKNNGHWQTLKALTHDEAAAETSSVAIAGKRAYGEITPVLPAIYPDKCNGCGDCISVCSSGMLYLINDRIALKKTGECDWCTYCEAVCLSHAILCPFEITLVDPTGT